MERFVSEYMAERPPNRCIDYNRQIKFGALLDWALGEGADLSRVTAACIGPQTEAEARQRGVFTITANQATIDSLVARIMEEN